MGKNSLVGYAGSKPTDIYSFTQAIRKEEYYLQQGKVFTFHPINVKSLREQLQIG